MPAICPHCWEFNLAAFLLCGRCGADMRTVLQESGGLRRTAAVQSPVPVGVQDRLSFGQRIALLSFLVMLLMGQIFGALLSVRSFAPDARLTPGTPSGDAGID